LLKELGFEADICATEDEAREKATQLKANSSTYPVYFFESNTSGEKSFEEFYTDDEQLDVDSFSGLGIIKNTRRKSTKELMEIFSNLESAFNSATISKASVVQVLKTYLPNFDHIEKGKNLDQSM
jgi:hypothetical protein